MSKRIIQILAAPETNLFLLAFLLNFVYEGLTVSLLRVLPKSLFSRQNQ